MRTVPTVTDLELVQLRLAAIISLAMRADADRRPPFGVIALIANADPDQAARALGVDRESDAPPLAEFARIALARLRGEPPRGDRLTAGGAGPATRKRRPGQRGTKAGRATTGAVRRRT